MGRDKKCISRREFVAAAATAGVAGGAALAGASKGVGRGGKGGLRAGACAVDISPEKLPVIVSGSFYSRTSNVVRDRPHARCLVLDDGKTRVVVMVVDSLFISREMLDEVKMAASKRVGIPPERFLISATHSHSCPSVVGCLGTDVDEGYAKFLPGKLVEAVEQATGKLEPAKVGWGVAQAAEHTHCRRWIFLPHRMRTDPFGQRNVRAHMHPGHQNPACVGPSGPPDPALSMLSVQAHDGRPIALLANYSMHYYGSGAVSADYYGEFCRQFTKLVGAEKQDPAFVAIMSHGTSGDQHWMDYSKPRHGLGLRGYATALAKIAHEAYTKIEHRESASIAMREQKVTFNRRLPDAKRLEWAKAVLAKMGNAKPRSMQQVYAREAMYLHNEPKRELKLQALRVGEIGITAIPCEVYALTGLKLKAQSPLPTTMNIELANGCESYIPPPELHPLGGYNTWPARTAGLEVEAETKITETVLRLLEDVAGKPRRKVIDPRGAYAQAVLAAKPLAYWRMADYEGRRALDSSGSGNHGAYEQGVVYYLEGPEADGLRGKGHTNRAAHFAGGRQKAILKGLGDTYSVELWFWNGMPANGRSVTGYLFSWGPDGVKACPGDHLGIGGTHLEQGKLLFFNGNAANEALGGTTLVSFKQWNHVVLVRQGAMVRVHLNGNPTPEITSEAAITRPKGVDTAFIGGRCDSFANFEGKICEAAIYNRALSPQDVASHYRLSGKHA